METVNISKLSQEEKKALFAQLQQEHEEEQKRLLDTRKTYKELVNTTIPELFLKLKQASEVLATVKKEVFEGVETLVDMKQEAYGRDDDQFTHSFTTDEGINMVLGCRVTDNWDDTYTAGLTKIDNWMKRQIKDKDTAILVGMISDLLTRDRKGQLNSKNVLKLRKKAEEINDPEFTDGVNIIMDAYKPIKGRQFITTRYKNDAGKMVDLPLDITAVDFEGKEGDK